MSLARYYGPEIRSDIALFLGPKSDIWGFTCVDARGRGIALAAPQGTRRTLPLGTRAWTMAAVHLATACRLRARRKANVEAVLSPNGKLLHRERSAEGSEKALAEAVVRRAEALRSAGRIGSEAALEAWRPLADGRWSIVEELESDGKHFLVARSNELDAGDIRGS